MAGKFKFTTEDYQQAAIKYRSELLYLPIFGINDTLQHMTGRPGIRYAERVGTISADAQFAPYNPSRETDVDLNLDFRELRTYFGSVVANFEPNTAISTLLGTGATKGDGQITTPTARHVLALIAKGLSKHLNNAVWNGKRNAAGDTTADLFDGFDTITSQEIAAGEISEEKKNYVKLADTINPANVVDILKQIMFEMDPHLRATDCNIYCSQQLVDIYNEGYQLTHGTLPYNTQYGQNAVEGSGGKLHFVPLFNKADSGFIHIAPKSNMLVGYDQMGDVESVMVKEYKPFVLSYIATMFFGCQFETLHSSRLKVVELAKEPFFYGKSLTGSNSSNTSSANTGVSGPHSGNGN